MSQRQLIPEERRRVLKMWRDGMSRIRIAEQMGRSYMCIWKVIEKARRDERGVDATGKSESAAPAGVRG